MKCLVAKKDFFYVLTGLDLFLGTLYKQILLNFREWCDLNLGRLGVYAPRTPVLKKDEDPNESRALRNAYIQK